MRLLILETHTASTMHVLSTNFSNRDGEIPYSYVLTDFSVYIAGRVKFHVLTFKGGPGKYKVKPHSLQ